jgi:hypothetical protein
LFSFKNNRHNLNSSPLSKYCTEVSGPYNPSVHWKSDGKKEINLEVLEEKVQGSDSCCDAGQIALS